MTTTVKFRPISAPKKGTPQMGMSVPNRLWRELEWVSGMTLVCEVATSESGKQGIFLVPDVSETTQTSD